MEPPRELVRAAGRKGSENAPVVSSSNTPSLTASKLYSAYRGIFYVLTQKQYVFEINQSRLNFQNEESPLESQAYYVFSARIRVLAVYLWGMNMQETAG